MEFKWITDWDAIWSDSFASQWEEWIERAENAHVFFHPAMVKVWTETYRPLRNLEPLFCVARIGETTIFLPLVIWEKNWKNAFIRTIIPVGYSDYDYQTPIVFGNTENVDWALYWNALKDEIYYQWNGKYDQVEISGIQEPFTGNKEKWKQVDESPLIELSNFGSYEELIGSLKSKERGDINRQRRRLEALGDFEYTVFGPNQLTEALTVLPTMLHHHSLRWPNAYKAPYYHENLIKEALPSGLMHFSQISIDGEPICWNLSFVYRRRYYFYMPTYVEKYKKYSPGKVNMFLSIEHMFELGYEKFDLLRGAEEYKRKLPTVSTKIYDLKIDNGYLISKLKNKVLNLRKMIR